MSAKAVADDYTSLAAIQRVFEDSERLNCLAQ